MKALCLVAHPDDCVIFAYSYMYHHTEYAWTVAYLTYTDTDPRGAEVKTFWNQRGIDCVFLGFEDAWQDQEQQTFTRWSQSEAMDRCRTLASTYDIVLTHDAQGDYGHIHHRLVHDAVQDHTRLVTFAPPNSGNVTLTLPPDAYSLQELPVHAEVVQQFHKQQHKNSYWESR